MTRARVQGADRIGVLRANGIGDFLMVVPALRSLRQCYPQAEITVIGDAWLPSLISGRPGPWDRVAVAPCYPGLRGVPPDAEPGPDLEQFLGEHRGRYDVLLQMHGGGGNSNTLVRLLEPRVAAGAQTGDAEPLDRSVPYLLNRNEVLRWLEVAALVGAAAPSCLEDLVPRITVTEGDLAASRQAWPHEVPFAAFHVGARDERRRWPAERFVALGERLQRDHSLHVVLVGGPADRGPSEAVAAALGRGVTDLSGTLSLGATLGLAARSTIFVGNDSGPRHLAVAAGVPTVGVFWVGNVITFGPLLGGNHRAAVSFTVNCPVCGSPQVTHRCGHDVSFVEDVTLEEVAAAVDSLLSPPVASRHGRGSGGEPARRRPLRSRT